MKPYQLTVAQVAAQFSTNIHTGLSPSQVKQRQDQYGKNELPDVATPTLFSIFFEQFKSPLIFILLFAAVIIFFVGEHKTDAFIISGVLFFNAIIGTIQQMRATNILAGLKRLGKSESIVVRDTLKLLVDDTQLVPGDVIIVRQGQRVPADARLIESNNVQVDEAVLTGESHAVHKTVDPLHGEVVLGDQTNMLFKGTYVVAGLGTAVIVSIGVNTEIGTIQVISDQIKTDIPLKKEIERLAYWILIVILFLCVFLFIVGALMGKPLNELLVMLTALFICVIPEGLPVVVTVVLVSGAYRLARKNVLVKNLQAVEALGRTDVIVIDKTGTLTRNEMIVSDVFADGKALKVSGQGYEAQGSVFDARGAEIIVDGEHADVAAGFSALQQVGVAGLLLNSSQITFLPDQAIFDIKGDPTEAALYILSGKLGLSHDILKGQYKKVYEIPFDSAYKYHAGFFTIDQSVHDSTRAVGNHSGQAVVFVIGSPEVILSRSVAVDDAVHAQLSNYLQKGLRVVAVASKQIMRAQLPPASKNYEDNFAAFQALCAHDLQFLGFCGMQDSIRADVKDIITQARGAGLKLIMATGDHKKTALFVAQQVGIFKQGDEIIDGLEFDQSTDEQLMERLDTITVYARVSPQQKMRIISLFHARNDLVAMTGDGINDAPSLVAADLGIAMGGIGTEVTKQASDLVLLDDSLASIISAIEEGRHIFFVLRRVILYFFATNLGEILIVLFALVAGLPLPLAAAQILWLNFVTDGFLDAALSLEPHQAGLLVDGAVARTMHLIDYNLLLKTFFMAAPMGLGSLCIFAHYAQHDIMHARTMTLVSMAMYQWFNAWNCRSERYSLFEIGLFTNYWLIGATILVLCLQLMLIYVPFMQMLFNTVPLSCWDWVLIIMVSSPIILIEELRKWVVRVML